jgi:hypothetical protein
MDTDLSGLLSCPRTALEPIYFTGMLSLLYVTTIVLGFVLGILFTGLCLTTVVIRRCRSALEAFTEAVVVDSKDTGGSSENASAEKKTE